ncbi:MAG TPA: hypothetical protein VIL49_11295, partial [Capillimicrobium sp.]
KLYPIVRSDVTRGGGFTFVLHTLPGGAVRAVVSAELLGQRRTAAVSALAATLLAPPAPRTLGIVGAGGQARHQAEALLAAMPFDEVRIASRTARSRDRLVDDLRREGWSAAGAETQDVVSGSDVVVTITGANEPVLAGAWLRAGTLIIAAGSNVATKRELDREAVERCARVIVDDVEGARLECGDLLANGVGLDGVTALADVLSAPAARCAPHEVVLFESQGLAIEDLMCAVHVVEAVEEEMGA